MEVAQECGVVSKGAALVNILNWKCHPNAHLKLRAKRYERLMKANGINPNGGPDPKTPPPSTPKVARSNQSEESAKNPAKRRKTNNTAATRTGVVSKEKKSVNPTPNVEQANGVKSGDEKPSLATSFPASVSQPTENQFKPLHQEESSFDFNEFCSPEMFEQCADDTNYLSQGVQPEPALVSQGETVSSNRVEESSQPVHGESKMAKTLERETVVIAD